MKPSRHLFAGVVLIMTIGFLSNAFAQGTPPQPPPVEPGKSTAITPLPILQSNSVQTLQELQAVEKRKNTQREQSIKTEISKLTQKMVGSPKIEFESCKSPKITSVYPAEVFPGSPVLIKGCGFGNRWGEVVISMFNRSIYIESWSDGRIQGKIPYDLAGFADPKPVTLKAVTPQRQESNPSASLNIFPNYEVKILEITPVVAPSSTPGCRSNLYTGNSFSHSSDFQQCRGVDTVLQMTTLKNHWSLHHFKELRDCRNFQTGEGDCVSGALSGNAMIKHRPVHFNDLIGRPNLPKLEIEWQCGSRWMIKYLIELYVKGPVGTSHR